MYCGFPISVSQDFAILNGIDPPTYYYIQKAIEKIRPIILQLAKDSALREKMKMPIRATVCVDGSWDHKRDGKLLVYDVICIELQKIVDFEDYNYLKKYGENMYDNVEGYTEKKGSYTIEQGYLEASNANVIREMVEMITISRAVEANQKFVQAADQTLEKDVNLGSL